MANSTGNYTALLSSFAHSTTFDVIPKDVVSMLQIYLLDIFGAMLIGTLQPVFRSAVDSVNITQGMPRANGYTAVDGTNSSLAGAILLNGIAAGDFEFEHVTTGAHPASAFFPALLTLAACAQISGKEFLSAMAIGYEISIRIGLATSEAVESERGFHNPGLNGALASAAVVGRLLGLNETTIASAMGIAASSSAGLLAFITTGAETKRLHPGRSAQLGAEAAFMAQSGITGPEDVIENPDGFLHAFSPAPQPGNLTDGLGTKWDTLNQIVKLNPVHAYAQAAVYSINEYRTEGHEWSPGDIFNVTVYSSEEACSPSHGDRAPATLVSAQYSVPFSIAASLTVDLRDPLNFNDSLLSNAETLRVAAGIKMVVDNQLTKPVYAIIDFDIKDQSVSLDAEDYPGFPGNPAYSRSVEHKFDRILTAIGIESLGPGLRQAVSSIVDAKDCVQLVTRLIEAGVASRHRNVPCPD